MGEEGSTPLEVAPSELLWRQYNTMVELFKFYLELALKTTTWFYGISGAIVTYYFSQPIQHGVVKYALLLPFVFSVGFGMIFGAGAYQAHEFKEMFNKIAEKLEVMNGKLKIMDREEEVLSLHNLPHTMILIGFLILSSVLFIGVGIALIWLFCNPQLGSKAVP